jgi:hypothetical protein
MKRPVCHLSRRERSDRIARCDPGEGFRCIDRPHPLTRRCAPTSPIEVGYIRLRQSIMPNSGRPELGGRGEEQPRRTFLATHENQCLNSLERSEEAIHFLRCLDCFASLATTEKASGDLLQAAAGRFKGRISRAGQMTTARRRDPRLPTSLYRIGSTGLPTSFVIPRRHASEPLMNVSPPWRAWGMPDARCTRGLVCML